MGGGSKEVSKTEKDRHNKNDDTCIWRRVKKTEESSILANVCKVPTQILILILIAVSSFTAQYLFPHCKILRKAVECVCL